MREALAHLRETQPGKHDRLMARMRTARMTRAGAAPGSEDEEMKKAEAAMTRALTSLLQTRLGASQQQGQVLQTQVEGLTGQVGSLTGQVLRDGTIKKGTVVGIVMTLVIVGCNIATMILEKSTGGGTTT